jgi:micrococcal nuclease
VRRALVVLVLVAAVLVVAVRLRGDGDRRPDGPADEGVVTHVVDGDTLDVDLPSGEERVRLLGIDTPESVAPDQPVECWGHEATAFLTELVPVGTEVRLERDAEARDRYGRLLAYVFRVTDGLFVNEAVLAAGAAETLSIPPNTAYADHLATASAAARTAALGLWSAC